MQTKITEMKGKLRHTEDRAVRWLELTEKTFNFATYARMAFLKASEMGKVGLELKKEILIVSWLQSRNQGWKTLLGDYALLCPYQKWRSQPTVGLSKVRTEQKARYEG